MASLHIYAGDTLEWVGSVTDAVMDHSFTSGLSGSITGTTRVAVDKMAPGVLSIVGGMIENSHFLKVGVGTKLYGGVVESCTLSDDGTYYSINFVGFHEYMDKVPALSAHLAADSSVGYSPEDDISWNKFFYAAKPVGILYAVFQNLQETMEALGYDSRLLNITALRDAAMASSGIPSTRSYRLNSFENPSMQTVVNDVLEDDDLEVFTVSVSDTVQAPFAFVLSVTSRAHETVRINERTGRVFNYSLDGGDVVRRAFSISTGSDLDDTNRMERVGFQSGVAFSALTSSAPAERSGAIRKSAEAAALAERRNFGTFRFSQYSEEHNDYGVYERVPEHDLLTRVILTMGDGSTITGVITEVAVDGLQVSYVVQTTTPSGDVTPEDMRSVDFKRPGTPIRRAITMPLYDTKDLSERTAQRRRNSTNWRT